MLGVVILFTSISLLLVTSKLFLTQSYHEKIVGLYFIFSNFVILILASAKVSFNAVLDIAILLSLLQFAAVFLSLIIRKK